MISKERIKTFNIEFTDENYSVQISTKAFEILGKIKCKSKGTAFLDFMMILPSGEEVRNTEESCLIHGT
jgi:hypothetical protein